MAGRAPIGSSALPILARARRRASDLGTLLAVVALASCMAAPGGSPALPSADPTAAPSPTSAATPSGSTDPAATPSPSAPTDPSASPDPSAPAPSAAPTPSPTPAATPGTDGWAPLQLPPAAAIGAQLAAVRGSPSATSGSAGFRVTATGDVPLATLLSRLRIEPAFAHRVVLDAGGRSAVLRPATALPAGGRYRFTLLDEERAPLTAWVFQVGGPLRVVGTIPADATTDVPSTTGIELTFDRDGVVLGPDDLIVRNMVDRSLVKGTLQRRGRSIAFVPAARLRAGGVYQVTLRAGAGAADGLPGVPQAVAFSFRVAPHVKVGSRHATFEEAFVTVSPGDHAVLRATAWKQLADGDTHEFTSPVRLRVYRLGGEPAGIAALTWLLSAPTWYGHDARPTVPTAGLPVVFAGRASFVKAGWEARLRVPVALGRGWYLLELRETTVNQAIVQVTDVATMAGAREDRTVVWANSTASGRPIVGASVRVVGGPSLGRTGANGVLVARTPAAITAPAGPVLVRVTAPNGRRGIVWLGDTASPKGYGDWMERHEEGLARWWSALATDRSLYRANDTITAWGYLRGRDGRLPSKVEVRVWRDTEGQRIGPIVSATAQRATTGAFAASLDIADLPHGYYLLESVADGQRVEEVWFDVGDVRKPAYELSVAAAPRAVIAGTSVKATVTARFYDGTPVAELPLVVAAGSMEQRNWQTVEHRVTTDTAGTAVARVRTKVPEGYGQEVCDDVGAYPDGAEEGEITGGRRVCVYRAAVYVDARAVRSGGTIVISGAVHETDLAAIAKQLRRSDADADWWEDPDPRGDPVAGRTVRIRITEQVLRRVVTSRWYDPISKQVIEEYETEIVRETTTTRTATTRADGTFRLRVTAQAKNRSWEIEAIVRDRAGRTTSQRAGVEGTTEDGGASSYEVRLRGGDYSYRVGAPLTAEIGAWVNGGRFRLAPTGARSRFLFLVLSPGRFQAIVRTSPVARTTFRSIDEPNLDIEGVWFTGTGYVTSDGAAAEVDRTGRTVKVTLATDRDRYEPGDTAKITIRTTDRAGRPVRASVLLRGIDGKLVAMGAAGLAEPLDLLYRSVPVGLVAGPAATHGIWLPGHEGGGAATGGGGGGDGGDRTDFADTLPLTLVTTSAAGTATVRYHLPDDVTAWRVGAAAITADRRAGQASVRVPVGLPFFAEARIAAEYLVTDRVAIRLRAFGSELASGAAVRFRVSSPTLPMAEVVVDGRAFTETLVELPALGEGTHRVRITAVSAAGSDTLVRTFSVVASRLRAGHRERIAIDGSVAVPGGDGLTRLVLSDAGRARYLDLLLGLAVPGGQRADERLAADVAREILATTFEVGAGDLPAAPGFDRTAYQGDSGGLALLPYGSADLELTVRALVADPDSLLAATVTPWLRGVADDAAQTLERRTVALVGLAALDEPVLGGLTEVADQADAGGRIRLWAAIGLGLLGDTARATEIERSILERWGERRGDRVRLLISGNAEEVSEATELAALLAAIVGDPLAEDLLAYVVAVPPADTLAVLTEVSVAGRVVGRLATAPAVVAVVRDGTRTPVEIPAGGAVTLEILASQRDGMRVEPVSGSAALVATWEETAVSAADLGIADPNLTLERSIEPAPPIAANRLVRVLLKLNVRGPERDGVVEVTDLAPSGLVAVGGAKSTGHDGCDEWHRASPARIEGQRVTFVVEFGGSPEDEEGYEGPTVPGWFCLAYTARVVTAGTYAWQPAVARQAVSPGLVAVTPARTVELR